MIKTILASVLLTASVAQAAEIKVLDMADRAFTQVSASLSVDLNSGAGSVKVVSSKSRPGPRARVTTTKTQIIAVDGLELVNGDLVLNTEEGSVVCGTMGTTRVLNRPTLLLSGDCRVVVKKVQSNGKARIQVSLKTI